MIYAKPYPLSYVWDHKTAVWRGSPCYAKKPPFHPEQSYPEYIMEATGDEPNPAYDGVRECLRLLGLDRERYGTSEWDPLKGIVKRGDKVVVKPNFVLSRHSRGGDLFSIITHPSVLRAVIDYVYKALEGEGSIIIADAPQMDCNFQELMKATQLAGIQELYSRKFSFQVEIRDLRDFWLDLQPGDTAAYSTRRFPLPGDPMGSVLIDLSKQSAFHGKDNWKSFYGADYTRQETIAHHQGEVQQYVVSKTALDADVFISVPKLKVHKKVGVTLNAKGLVGIVTNKNCLVHYTLGTPEKGGDQFPPNLLLGREEFLVKSQRLLYDALLSKRDPFLDKVYHVIARAYKKILQPARWGVSPDKRILDAGNWYGNDSAWRMVVDLMRIILFADREGRICKAPQRRIFSFVDGIIGGENDGPLSPDAVASGVVVAGANLLAVDIVGTMLMGLHFSKLKWITYLLESRLFGICSERDIEVVSSVPDLSEILETGAGLMRFRPHPGWKGHLDT
jgi:uncharacterized protein (DUF362 family)